MSIEYSILLPSYNEEAGLAVVIERLVSSVRTGGRAAEILIVDDGSSDGTPEIARTAAERYPEIVRTIRHETNAGLLAGLRSGSLAARAPVVVVLDADLSYAPEIVEPMVDALIRRDAGIAMASPYMKGGTVAHVPFDRLLASRGANWILSACSFGRIKTFTGMVRAYRADVLLRYLEREPIGEFNSWLVAEALRDGVRIVEVPAHLEWPPERYASPPRISRSKLFKRAFAVIRTASILSLVSIRSRFGTKPIGP